MNGYQKKIIKLVRFLVVIMALLFLMFGLDMANMLLWDNSVEIKTITSYSYIFINLCLITTIIILAVDYCKKSRKDEIEAQVLRRERDEMLHHLPESYKAQFIQHVKPFDHKKARKKIVFLYSISGMFALFSLIRSVLSLY